MSAFFTTAANAADYVPSVGAIDRVGGVIYYHNGTTSYGPGNGTLTIGNPAPSSPLSGVNVTMPNGSALFIGEIAPMSGRAIDYAIEPGDIEVPLSLKEAIAPASLSYGLRQQVRLCIRVENTGDGNITGFTYRKTLPAGLTVAWAAYDGGTLHVNDTVSWTLDRLVPGENKSLAIAFNLTPSSDVFFPEARIGFDYDSSLAGGSPGMSASTTASFGIRKSLISAGLWQVNALVSDDSEFAIAVGSVTVSRSDASDPFNAATIASYAPGTTLEPGCSWTASINDDFGTTPAYFIKVSYDIPYTLDRRSFLSGPARTEPFTLVVDRPAATARPGQSIIYAPWMPTAAPPHAQAPDPEPDIVFVTPAYGDVVRDNATDILVSVPPSDDPGYVAYYGSEDNKTWMKLGESPVSSNMSGLTWAVPPMNGKYYFRAEHYNAMGLRGIAFTQVLIAHEIAPVDMTTLLARGMDWLMFLLALIALLLLLFIALPYLPGKPVVYDSSALAALRRPATGRPSKLSRRAIRPEVDFEGAEGIRMKAVRNVEEMRRLEREYGLLAYDAMALQLARETGATLFTADARIGDIGRKLGIDVTPLAK